MVRRGCCLSAAEASGEDLRDLSSGLIGNFSSTNSCRWPHRGLSLPMQNPMAATCTEDISLDFSQPGMQLQLGSAAVKAKQSR